MNCGVNAEKIVKNEARQALGKNNWVKAITAIMVLAFVPVIALLIMEIAYSFAIDSSGEFSESVLTSSTVKMVFFVVFQLIAVLEIVLLSPLLNGCVRIFCSIADRQKAEFSDLFYFFENKERYLNSIIYMLGLLVKIIFTFLLCCIPAIIVYAAAEVKYHENFAKHAMLVNTLNTVAVILLVIGFIAAILIIHRYMFSLSLYSYYGYDSKTAAKVGADAAKKYCSSLIKLTIKFIPWILLLFFVIPFLYVCPYMFCSYAVSVKYLFSSMGLQFNNNAENDETVNANSGVGNIDVTSGKDSDVHRESVSSEATPTVSSVQNESEQEENTAQNTAETDKAFDAAEFQNPFSNENESDENYISEQNGIGGKNPHDELAQALNDNTAFDNSTGESSGASADRGGKVSGDL